MSLKEFADTLPDYAKDIRLNISSLLNDQMLGDQRKYGLLLACAHGTGYQPIVQATEREVEEKLSDAAKNAARAAAAVMPKNQCSWKIALRKVMVRGRSGFCPEAQEVVVDPGQLQ